MHWTRASVIGACVACGLGLLACSDGHTVEPYRSDPAAAAWLEAEAARICAEMDTPSGVPDRAFTTDGCSASPDGDKVGCCVEHDIPYWCGGSKEQRRRADECLGHCVAELGQPVMGWIMERVVRVGGHPFVPAGWRWGFGWDYPAGYDGPGPVADTCPSLPPLP